MLAKLHININTLEVECDDPTVDINEISQSGDWITVEVAQSEPDTPPETSWQP